MFFLATAAAMTLAALFSVRALTGESRQRRRSLIRVAEYDLATISDERARTRRSPAKLRTGAPALARIGLRLTPRSDLESVRLRLARAGLADRYSAEGFLARKTLAGVFGVGLGVLLAVPSGSIGRIIVYALVLGYGCFTIPEFVVSRRLTARLRLIETDLPNALDVLAISVGAGLGLDAAISVLTQHSKGALTDELAFTLAEMRMGESRVSAMRRLGDRVDLPEMASFVTAVVQGDRLGIPLSRILRTLAVEVRTRRQLKAEEEANKMPVKMIFPLGFFILPSLLLVTLGPAVISIAHTLGH